MRRYIIAREVSIVNVPDDVSAGEALEQYLAQHTADPLPGMYSMIGDDIAWKTVAPTKHDQAKGRHWPVMLVTRAPWSPGNTGEPLP